MARRNIRVVSTDKGAFVDMDGVQVDLNSGMVEAANYPPIGFVSKHRFRKSNMASRLKAIDWFANCGKAMSLDVTMPVVTAAGWREALRRCNQRKWTGVQIESMNQLRVCLPDEKMDNWNETVAQVKASSAYRRAERRAESIREQHAFDIFFVWSCMADVSGAMLENFFIGTGHGAFFNLELLQVYEAGHFPCGWDGKWPKGKLVVY